jgi:hypothetical protein
MFDAPGYGILLKPLMDLSSIYSPGSRIIWMRFMI